MFRPEVALVVVLKVCRGPVNNDSVTTFEVVDEVPADAPGFMEERVYHAERAGMLEPFSLAAGFLGWGVATFFSLVLLGIVLGFVGAAAYNNAVVTEPSVVISQATLDNLASAGIVAGLVAIFAGYAIGGYNAGRIDRTHGLGQGIAIVGWTLAFAFVSWAVAAASAVSLTVINEFSPFGINWTGLTTRSILVLVLTFFVMLGGALLGGYTAERAMRRRTEFVEERVVVGRGRPRY